MKAAMLFLMVIIVFLSGCTAYRQSSGANLSVSQQTNQTYVADQQPAREWDYGTVGSLNHELLQTQPFPNVIIEIDYTEGYQPTAQTRNALKLFFEDVANKPVYFAGENAIQSTKNAYTVSDLYQLEKQNRNQFTGNGSVVIYFLFVNGGFENENALGVAYGASSAAIFVEKLNEQTTALVLYTQIEEAVAMHELGHLLGLVNLNYRSEREREDPAHRGHSTLESSVMFWAVEDTSLKNLLNFGPPSEFDQHDLFDIGKIKSGTY